MESTPSDRLLKKIGSILNDLGDIEKDTEILDVKFTSFNHTLEFIRPKLRKEGLDIVGECNGEHVYHIIIDIDTGESYPRCYIPIGQFKDLQDLGMRLTYALKYSLFTGFMLRRVDNDCFKVGGIPHEKPPIALPPKYTGTEFNDELKFNEIVNRLSTIDSTSFDLYKEEIWADICKIEDEQSQKRLKLFMGDTKTKLENTKGYA